MTPEQAVRELVLELGAVTALVSTRVYLEKMPQSVTYPCVRVQLIDEQSSYHMRGGKTSPARVQVDAFAKELSGIDPYALVVTVAAEINGDDAGSGLSGFQGDIGASPPFHVQAILRVARTKPVYVPDELRVLMMSQDYMVHF